MASKTVTAAVSVADAEKVAKLELRLERKSLVLALRFAGGKREEIADLLGIAPTTIDYYQSSDSKFKATWRAASS